MRPIARCKNIFSLSLFLHLPVCICILIPIPQSGLSGYFFISLQVSLGRPDVYPPKEKKSIFKGKKGDRDKDKYIQIGVDKKSRREKDVVYVTEREGRERDKE